MILIIDYILTCDCIQALSMRLQEAWHAFKVKLNEAEVFVTAQTPIKAQGLQESIEVSDYIYIYIYTLCS